MQNQPCKDCGSITDTKPYENGKGERFMNMDLFLCKKCSDIRDYAYRLEDEKFRERTKEIFKETSLLRDFF